MRFKSKYYLAVLLLIWMSIWGAAWAAQSAMNLPDGIYVPNSFSFSGGTGRVEISCAEVQIDGGQAFAAIEFSSPNYRCVEVDGVTYEGTHTQQTSSFQIPVLLNCDFQIYGTSTAMSSEHKIEYTLHIELEGAASEHNEGMRLGKLNFSSKEALSAAELFEIEHYEGGYSVICVRDVGRYLILPANAEVPEGIDPQWFILRKPVQAAFVSSERIYQVIAETQCANALSAIKLTGFEGEMPGAVYGGSSTDPDYAQLLKAGCDLYILDSNAPSREDADSPLASRLEMLEIPLFVDRSGEEKSDAGRAEWQKVYALLFN